MIRPFLVAGASSIIATNWVVANKTAFDFEVKFYKELLHSGRTVAEDTLEARRYINKLIEEGKYKYAKSSVGMKLFHLGAFSAYSNPLMKFILKRNIE